jgi:hypothetical protein
MSYSSNNLSSCSSSVHLYWTVGNTTHYDTEHYDKSAERSHRIFRKASGKVWWDNGGIFTWNNFKSQRISWLCPFKRAITFMCIPYNKKKVVVLNVSVMYDGPSVSSVKNFSIYYDNRILVTFSIFTHSVLAPSVWRTDTLWRSGLTLMSDAFSELEELPNIT